MVFYKEWEGKSADELRTLWWGLRAKIDSPENDGRITAGGSFTLDSWFDDQESIEKRLIEMGEAVPMVPPEDCVRVMKSSRPPLSEDTVRNALQEAWDDWCADTNSYPDCFIVSRGPHLTFDAGRCGNFISSVTMELNAHHERATARAIK